MITIDAVSNNISVDVSDSELAERRNKWVEPAEPLKGFLKKYRSTVASASLGCITC